MELNLNNFTNKTFHMSIFLGQDTGVIKLGVVMQINAVLSIIRIYEVFQ